MKRSRGQWDHQYAETQRMRPGVPWGSIALIAAAFAVGILVGALWAGG